MTVLIYVNTSKQVGDADHLKVFANVDAAETWFEENGAERPRKPGVLRSRLFCKLTARTGEDSTMAKPNSKPGSKTPPPTKPMPQPGPTNKVGLPTPKPAPKP